MKIAIAVFDGEDKLISKQDIMQLCDTHSSFDQDFPLESAAYVKQEFMETLSVEDFKKLLMHLT